jgi:hypothetical protein
MVMTPFAMMIPRVCWHAAHGTCRGLAHGLGVERLIAAQAGA